MGKSVHVFAHWQDMDQPEPIGVLNAESVRNSEVFSFEYDSLWLKKGFNQGLDPDLQWYAGRQFPPPDKINFGMFLDSSPDRWGRFLMRRRESLMAGSEKRHPERFGELDYLLGVDDYSRLGALRFKTEQDGPFLAVKSPLSVPPWEKLRDLEYGVSRVESDDHPEDEASWLELLLAPGSSLGGARPKAGVLHPDGSLWIAKFPSRQDEEDSGAWEMTVHELACSCGLDVPEARLEKLSPGGSTFLVKRFDRTGHGGRIHFASAMTLLGRKDGDNQSDGASYLDLAELLIRHGSNPQKDLEQLWRRIIFSIAVSNTDDHLRNHGFLLAAEGWRLSPAFDINPNPYGRGLSLNIDEYRNALEPELAMGQASVFRLTPHQAQGIAGEVFAAVSRWKKVASGFGISRSSCDRMESAFRF
jgi:serine/threonine-protein kinase HipA